MCFERQLNFSLESEYLPVRDWWQKEFLPSELPVSSFLLAVCSRYEDLACSFWHTAGAQSHSCLNSPEKKNHFVPTWHQTKQLMNKY